MGLLPPDLRHADPVIQRLLDWLKGLAAAIVVSIFGAAGIKVRFGTDIATYPGGTPISNGATVTHGLGKTPIAVLVSSHSVNHYARPAAAPTNTTFGAQARTLDGTSPGAGATIGFYWLAIG